MAKATEKTRRLTQLALLVAIMLVLAFTPLGYLKLGPALEITFMTIPVAVGAILLGPASGAFLGGVFGLTSFIQCFGMSQFGATLLGIDAVRTFLVCMVSRVLMGWLCGLIFKALHKLDKTRFLSYAAASLSAAVLNTVFFMGLLMLLFGQTDFILNMRGGMNLIAFLAAFVGIQGVVEAIVAFALGTAISKAVSVVLARK
ncbi:MAG: ECF transporter S component [Oscillospiraceae bacterium]|nr:ECF transporter S component [Oscillospiraceae bacterium]MBQ2792365.1 ECF transporter S component [Oscillospiraceae bacterium]MBQ7082163.1 ECF transporter S component [Oscillospiraceae bacterium]MBR6607356.1 ECF transporter S component [Oscillospiraceae bacterium]